MNEQYVRNVVEAALLAAGRALSLEELTALFGVSETSNDAETTNEEEVRAALTTLESDYQDRGLELKEVANGYRIQIRSNVAEPVSKLWQERPAKYSRAMLETLALVAYRQPITRGEIEQIRGVAVNPNIIKTLLERSWIRVVGHRDVPGKPELLGTTSDFLDYFNLKKLDDLPTLVQLKEMEELRLQLALPGAEVAHIDVANDSVEVPAAGAVAVDAAAVDAAGSEQSDTDVDAELDSDIDGGDDDEQDNPPVEARPQGLVASGPDHES